MGKEVTVSINNRVVLSPEGTSVLVAADTAGIYIPRLCHHPALPPGPGTAASPRVYRDGEITVDSDAIHRHYDGCNLCIVEIEGKKPSPACTTIVEEGMVILTDTAALQELRIDKLSDIIARHPHACMFCSESSGCDKDGCTEGVDRDCRCCSNFGDCEFQKLCEYVTIKENVAQYLHENIPVIDTPFFTVDSSLCVGCTRCIRACARTQGKSVIGFTWHNGKFVLGTLAPTHRESGCVFCGACVTVCPTGALMDKGHPWKKKAELGFAPAILPPEDDIEYTEDALRQVPEINGVYQLFDESQQIIYIHGTDNLRKDLLENFTYDKGARFFRYEEYGMYTMRENELLERFLKKHGILPKVNNEISDLY